ncbi:polyketide hydroxylase [Streptomyces sp. Ru71]|uniref:FAD-dependent oxidoreductase n=1 Tax=Streptomyces sp. Ru71 TaxID=2080746 RepID=UPI000CDE18B1|nr:FAD-dependent monooxygenase [Streptomyces sp. Ru71]POX56744.1 polyketide hydroxylase [Streptomyces sp. Ru71]
MKQQAGQEAVHRVPVLIVGGSLVGLSTSVFLGRLGVRHTLVERHAGTSIHPRGRGNNVRTMELFRVAGVEGDIHRAAATLAENHGILQTPTLVGDAGEWLFKRIDAGGSLARFSPTSWCLCSQNDLEPVLLEHAVALGGDIRFSTELMSFDVDGDGVSAVAKSRETGEHLHVRADYLVAADGPRSPIREQLGIGQSGPGDLFHNVSITFRSRGLAEVVGDRRFIVCYLTSPEADGALLPVDNREHWVFHAPWHPEHGETVEEFTDERCIAHIRRAVGVDDLDVEITGRAPWHAAQRVARSYRSGRVFLAGDSAHEMSPTGAFGSNTGIQDAHNLAWKLAGVLGGWAGDGLLDSYDAERRPVAEATSARAAVRSVEHSHPGFSPGAVDPGLGAGAGGAGVGVRVGAVAAAPAGAVAVAPAGPVAVEPAGTPVGAVAVAPAGAVAVAPDGPPSGSVAVAPAGAPAGAVAVAPAGSGPGAGGRRPGGILDVALGYRYPAGAVVGADAAGPVVPDRLDLSGAPGSRAPHLWVRRDGERVSTLDLYETSLVLLCDAEAGRAWYDAALRLADELRVPLRPYRMGPGGDLVPEDGASWSDAHGVAAGGAVLVRPDAFVAWRTAHAVQDAERELRWVLGKVLSLRT